MVTESIILAYLYTRVGVLGAVLDNAATFGFALTILATIVAFISRITYTDASNEYDRAHISRVWLIPFNRLAKGLACATAVLFLVASLIPSKDDMKVIVGVAVAAKVVDEVAKAEITGKILDLISAKVDKSLEDLKKVDKK